MSENSTTLRRHYATTYTGYQIRQRIVFNICTIVYMCIHGTAPSCLAEMCIPVATSTGRRNLRSATHGNLLVPRTRTITYGPRSFAVSGVDPVSGITCHWPCVHPAHSDSFKAHWRQYCFVQPTDMIWRFRDCLGH